MIDQGHGGWRKAFAVLVLACVALAPAAFAASPPAAESVAARLAQVQQALTGLEQNVLSTRAAARAAVDAVEKLALNEAEAKACGKGELTALAPGRAAAVKGALPAVAAHDEHLEAYFAAYDEWATLKMDEKVLSVLADLEKTRAQLAEQLGEGDLKHFDELAAEVKKNGAAYWEHRDVSEGRESWRRYADLRNMSAAGIPLEDEIAKLGQQLGTIAKPTLKQRISARLGDTRRFFQRFRRDASMKVPMAKIVAHLANPWASDPDRVSAQLQDMGRRFVKEAKIDIQVVGREHLGGGRRLIIAPSHRNVYVDPFSMFSVLEGPITVIQTILWFPSWAHATAVKWTADEPGVILAHTDGVDVIALCEKAIRAGRTLLFFPEGNIPSPLGEIRRIRSGLQTIGEKTLDHSVAIVPVTLKDPVEAWGAPVPGTHGRELGAKVTVVFDRPLDVKTVHALSFGRAKLLGNLLREHYHQNLIPSLADGAAASQTVAPAPAKRDRAARFLELHSN